MGRADNKGHVPCPAAGTLCQKLRQLVGGDLFALNAHGYDGSPLAHIGKDGFSLLIQRLFYHRVRGVFLLDLFLRQFNDAKGGKSRQTLLVLCHALGKIFCIQFAHTDQVDILHNSFLFSGSTI